MPVRVVGVLVAAGFRRHAGYRAAAAAGALTNSVFGLLRASIVAAAVGAAGGTIAGYDRGYAVTFAWVTQALIAPVYVFTWTELADRVRTGDVAIDLARPVDLQLQYGAADLGRALFTLLPRSVPPLLVGALTFGLAMPTSPMPYLLGGLALLIGIGISFACRFAVNLVAFWLLDIRGPNGLFVLVSNLLCGLYAPVPWFPGWLHALALATPFPSMVQTPADLLTGRVTGGAARLAVAVQLGWLVATVLLGRLILHRATHRLVVQGG
jgi:ABC-2 type transport system permease protein